MLLCYLLRVSIANYMTVRAVHDPTTINQHARRMGRKMFLLTFRTYCFEVMHNYLVCPSVQTGFDVTKCPVNPQSCTVA